MLGACTGVIAGFGSLLYPSVAYIVVGSLPRCVGLPRRYAGQRAMQCEARIANQLDCRSLYVRFSLIRGFSSVFYNSL